MSLDIIIDKCELYSKINPNPNEILSPFILVKFGQI